MCSFSAQACRDLLGNSAQLFGVPIFLIGAELFVGFLSAETTGTEIRARLDQRVPGAGVLAPVESIQTKWFGELRVRDLGLPLFTIVIGLLDGFNPCAMRVLLFLLSLLVNLRDRLKMAFIAGTFVAVRGLVYFVFMAAWLNMFLLIGLSRLIEAIPDMLELDEKPIVTLPEGQCCKIVELGSDST